MVNGNMTLNMVMEHFTGMMVEYIKVNGKMILDKDLEFIKKKKQNTQDILLIIKNLVKEK